MTMRGEYYTPEEWKNYQDEQDRLAMESFAKMSPMERVRRGMESVYPYASDIRKKLKLERELLK